MGLQQVSMSGTGGGCYKGVYAVILTLKHQTNDRLIHVFRY